MSTHATHASGHATIENLLSDTAARLAAEFTNLYMTVKVSTADEGGVCFEVVKINAGSVPGTGSPLHMVKRPDGTTTYMACTRFNVTAASWMG